MSPVLTGCFKATIASVSSACEVMGFCFRSGSSRPISVLGLGLDADAVRPAPELDSPVGAQQISLEFLERRVHLVFTHAEALGQSLDGHWTVRGDQQRLDLGLQFPCFFHRLLL
jgi:hypothetical protein